MFALQIQQITFPCNASKNNNATKGFIFHKNYLVTILLID